MSDGADYKVYRLTCVPNGKLYFGITKRKISQRMKQHRSFARSGSSFLISRAIRRYGWESFKVDVIACGLTQSDACAMEIMLIDKHQTCYENGYNMETGGQTGVSVRPETTERRSRAGKNSWLKSEKMRASVKDPERNRKIGLHSKILHKDPIYRDKFLSRHASMIEKSKDPKCRARAVETYKSNGHATRLLCSNGMTFESIAEAADWVATISGGDGIGKRSSICAASKGRRRTAYGLKWDRI